MSPKEKTRQPLTLRQQSVMNLFHEAEEARRPLPSFREIGDALGIASTNGVADHVKALIRKGYLQAPATPIARGHVPTAMARLKRSHAKQQERKRQRAEAGVRR